ncbi:hypothetical protein ACJJTC_013794 [Scirpophaga incertulas]
MEGWQGVVDAALAARRCGPFGGVDALRATTGALGALATQCRAAHARLAGGGHARAAKWLGDDDIVRFLQALPTWRAAPPAARQVPRPAAPSYWRRSAAHVARRAARGPPGTAPCGPLLLATQCRAAHARLAGGGHARAAKWLGDDDIVRFLQALPTWRAAPPAARQVPRPAAPSYWRRSAAPRTRAWRAAATRAPPSGWATTTSCASCRRCPRGAPRRPRPARYRALRPPPTGDAVPRRARAPGGRRPRARRQVAGRRRHRALPAGAAHVARRAARGPARYRALRPPPTGDAVPRRARAPGGRRPRARRQVAGRRRHRALPAGAAHVARRAARGPPGTAPCGPLLLATQCRAAHARLAGGGHARAAKWLGDDDIVRFLQALPTWRAAPPAARQVPRPAAPSYWRRSAAPRTRAWRAAATRAPPSGWATTTSCASCRRCPRGAPRRPRPARYRALRPPPTGDAVPRRARAPGGRRPRARRQVAGRRRHRALPAGAAHVARRAARGPPGTAPCGPLLLATQCRAAHARLAGGGHARAAKWLDDDDIVRFLQALPTWRAAPPAARQVPRPAAPSYWRRSAAPRTRAWRAAATRAPPSGWATTTSCASCRRCPRGAPRRPRPARYRALRPPPTGDAVPRRARAPGGRRPRARRQVAGRRRHRALPAGAAHVARRAARGPPGTAPCGPLLLATQCRAAHARLAGGGHARAAKWLGDDDIVRFLQALPTWRAAPPAARQVPRPAAPLLLATQCRAAHARLAGGGHARAAKWLGDDDIVRFLQALPTWRAAPPAARQVPRPAAPSYWRRSAAPRTRAWRAAATRAPPSGWATTTSCASCRRCPRGAPRRPRPARYRALRPPPTGDAVPRRARAPGGRRPRARRQVAGRRRHRALPAGAAHVARRAARGPPGTAPCGPPPTGDAVPRRARAPGGRRPRARRQVAGRRRHRALPAGAAHVARRAARGPPGTAPCGPLLLATQCRAAHARLAGGGHARAAKWLDDDDIVRFLQALPTWRAAPPAARQDWLSANIKTLPSLVGGPNGLRLTDKFTNDINSAAMIFEEISHKCLLFLHLELRIECFYYLGQEDRGEGGEGVGVEAVGGGGDEGAAGGAAQLARALLCFHEHAVKILSPDALAYVFGGLGEMMSAGVVWRCQSGGGGGGEGRLAALRHAAAALGLPPRSLQRAAAYLQLLRAAPRYLLRHAAAALGLPPRSLQRAAAYLQLLRAAPQVPAAPRRRRARPAAALAAARRRLPAAAARRAPGTCCATPPPRSACRRARCSAPPPTCSCCAPRPQVPAAPRRRRARPAAALAAARRRLPAAAARRAPGTCCATPPPRSACRRARCSAPPPTCSCCAPRPRYLLRHAAAALGLPPRSLQRAAAYLQLLRAAPQVPAAPRRRRARPAAALAAARRRLPAAAARRAPGTCCATPPPRSACRRARCSAPPPTCSCCAPRPRYLLRHAAAALGLPPRSLQRAAAYLQLLRAAPQVPAAPRRRRARPAAALAAARRRLPAAAARRAPGTCCATPPAPQELIASVREKGAQFSELEYLNALKVIGARRGVPPAELRALLRQLSAALGHVGVTV